MNLFYAPELKTHDLTCTLDREESIHCMRAARRSVGQSVLVTNGYGLLAEGIISGTDNDQCVIRITNSRVEEKREWNLHMAVAPPKNHDRFEWFVEKAAEIGIDSVIPLICEHSERKNIHLLRLNRLLISAMKQSLKTYLPQLYPETKFTELISKGFSGQKLIATGSDSSAIHLKKVLKKITDILILIGPEGDFSDEEISLAKQHGFIPVSLGQNRLRTETAALVACTGINMIFD